MAWNKKPGVGDGGSYDDSQLVKKVNDVASKADNAATELPKKADKTYVDAELNKKADAALLAEMSNLGFPINTLGNAGSNINEWKFDTNQRLHLLVYGDSISAGAFGDIQEINWYKTGWVGRLHNLLKRQYGDGGRGFIGLWDKAWTKTGTWTSNADFGPWGSCFFANSPSSTYTLNGVFGDSVEVYYVNNAAMTFSYSVNGGTAVQVSATSPFDNKVAKQVIELPNLGTHTIQINGASVGNLFLIGASVYTGKSGLVINNLSRSSMTASLAQYKFDGRMDFIKTHFSPKLTILNFLANDFAHQADSNNAIASYGTHLNTLAGKFKSMGSELVMWQPPKGTKVPTTLTTPREQYYAKSKEVAVANNAAWLDFWNYWGDNNQDKMHDDEHPNVKGHKEIALAFSRLLR